MQRNIVLQNINPYLICSSCGGYLIDATTIVECLHSFCRSCIIKHLEISYNCPKCNTEIHKSKPLEYIRSDPSLQEIVYKLVPDLYFKEEQRRDEWRKLSVSDDEAGTSTDQTTQDTRIMLTLKYFRGTSRMERIKAEKVLQLFPTRYLCCQPEMPVHVLKKFIRYKFDISTEMFRLELWRGDETLLDELTLKQLIQIYGLYRERKPLELHFSLFPKFKQQKSDHEHCNSIASKMRVETSVDTNSCVSMETALKDDTTTSRCSSDEETALSEEARTNVIPNIVNMETEKSLGDALDQDEDTERDRTEAEAVVLQLDKISDTNSNSDSLEPILPRSHSDDEERIDEIT